MVFEQIEQLKKQYTDKYVQVDADAPELARFKGVTGQIKTVNMSGRALVQFDDYHLNIAWYDIAFDYLKVVDKPEPKAPESKAEKKANPAPTDKAKAPAATEAKKLSPLELARQQGAGGAAAKAPAAEKPAAEKPASAGKKLSVAEMMAAARANKPTAATSEAKAPEAKAAPPVEKPAATAEPKAPGAVPAKADKGKLSVAEMLAAARSNKPAAAAPAAPVPPKAAAPAAAPEPIAAPPDDVPPTAVAPEPEPEVAAPAASKPAAAGAVDKKSMSIADMVAWCKEHDTK